MTTWAVVVAAGRGERYGRPKQYEILLGRRVLDWSTADARATCDGVVLVVPPERAGVVEDVDAVVAGGDTRSQSVRNGLAAVPGDASVVVVHDAARPAAGVGLFRAVIAAIEAGADGAIPGIAVTDTVKRIDRASTVVETLDRSTLIVVQTPQAFGTGALRRAHAGNPDATDDAALVERRGGRVVVVPGHTGNRKLTEPEDLAVLEAELRR